MDAVGEGGRGAALRGRAAAHVGDATVATDEAVARTCCSRQGAGGAPRGRRSGEERSRGRRRPTGTCATEERACDAYLRRMAGVRRRAH